MMRIDVLINDPNVYYDDQAIDGFIEFDGGRTHAYRMATMSTCWIRLKLWAEQLLSWFIFVERPDLEQKELPGLR